jgi:D-3-phosphoglycerate dehydrogenase
LKIIARVGVGYNNIDLDYSRIRNIKITYIPDGPDAAVADLTIGLMYSLLRATHISNLKLHNKEWERYIGRRLKECRVGIIGVGKIGYRVATDLEKIGTNNILLCDLEQNYNLSEHPSMKWADLSEILDSCDVISFHLPLTPYTENLITEKELLGMKTDAVIVNTSRGGIINEEDLYQVLKSGHLFGAALDVFRDEPYLGNLTEIDRCLLTAHTASMTIDCRTYMEFEAIKEVIRFSNGKDLKCEIPNN